MYGKKKGNSNININVTNKFNLLSLDNSENIDAEEKTENESVPESESVHESVHDPELEMINNYYKNTKKETNTFKQNFYPKKRDNFSNSFDNSFDNNFKVVSNKRKDKDKVIKTLDIIEIPENFMEEKLSNYYRVLGHHNEDKSWDYISYYNITTLNNWLDMSSFLNTLNTVKGECSLTDFDIYVMKNEISPMWEDLDNRNGSICSVKIDSLVDGYDIFRVLLTNICNNSLLCFSSETWNTINGISFSSKKIDNIKDDNYCVIIKLWFKLNLMMQGSIDKHINPHINDLIKKYSIKVKAIKPEY
jgi:hypothetical protein